jgi:hypothetical protein
MSIVKNIRSDLYYITESSDGILIAFQKTNENDKYYSDRIYEIVKQHLDDNKSFLFATDIIEKIDCFNDVRNILNESLYVRIGNKTSISAYNVFEFYGKDEIIVKYFEEEIIIIQKRNITQAFWVIIILIISFFVALFCGDYIIDFFKDKRQTTENKVVTEEVFVKEKPKTEYIDLTSSTKDENQSNNDSFPNNTDIKSPYTEIAYPVVDHNLLSKDHVNAEESYINDDVIDIKGTINTEPIKSNEESIITINNNQNTYNRHNSITKEKKESDSYLVNANKAFDTFIISLADKDAIEAYTSYIKFLEITSNNDIYYSNDTIEIIKSRVNKLTKILKL